MTPRTPLAIDIETVGIGWERLHPEVQAYLLGRARDESERAAVPDRLGLSAGTGRVVAIGMWRPLEGRGGVLVTGEGAAEWVDLEPGAKVFYGSEEEVLREFWRTVSEIAGTIVTYNGRGFDGPFLMIRSAMLGVSPTRNLVPYRYSFQDHCDLAEVLSFHRSTTMYSLNYWCHQFGIPTPKGEMDGSGVQAAYEQGALEAIARYCLGDARATAELFKRCLPLIAAMDGRPEAWGGLADWMSAAPQDR